MLASPEVSARLVLDVLVLVEVSALLVLLVPVPVVLDGSTLVSPPSLDPPPVLVSPVVGGSVSTQSIPFAT